MTNLKNSILALTLLFTSYSSSDEAIIKNYLKNNLNDASSYEPVEFNTDDLTIFERIPDIEMQLSMLENDYIRQIDLVPNLVNTFKNNLTTDHLTQIIELRAKCARFGPFGLSNLVEVTALQVQFSKSLETAIAELEKKEISSPGILELKGTINRIQVEKEKLNEILNMYGLNPTNKYNNTRAVYHKYRTKNEFGALILKETIFFIDIKSHKVIKTLDLKVAL